MSSAWDPSNAVSVSRVYRRTFFEKIEDSYDFFNGRKFSEEDTLAEKADLLAYQVGLVSYMTVFSAEWSALGFLACLGMLYSDDAALNVLGGILIVPAAVLAGIMTVLHLVLSVLLTVLAAPFVGLTHLVSEYIAGGAELKEQAGKLHLDKDTTLESFLNDNDYSFSDIMIRLKEDSNRTAATAIRDETLIVYSHDEKKQYPISLNEIKINDQLAIKALLAMDAGGLFQNTVRSDINHFIPEGYNLESKLDGLVLSF